MSTDYKKYSTEELRDIIFKNPPDTPHFKRAQIELQHRWAQAKNEEVESRPRSET